MSIKTLMAIVQALGTKLPQVWPDIVEIGVRLRHILEVAGFRMMENIGPPVSDQGGEVVKFLAEQGILHEEANKVAAIIEQFDGRFGG